MRDFESFGPTRLLVSMAPLKNELRPLEGCFPPHLGPSVPEMSSVWFKMFLYRATGSGPPSLLLPKGLHFMLLLWYPTLPSKLSIEHYELPLPSLAVSKFLLIGSRRILEFEVSTCLLPEERSGLKIPFSLVNRFCTPPLKPRMLKLNCFLSRN